MANANGYQVVWSFAASEDLADLHAYIELDSPTAADRVIDILLELGDSLTTYPYRHPIEELLQDAPLEFRFLPKWNYKIIYHVEEAQQRVIIARIFDTRQDPSKLEI
ncbi:MAG: type II toxin-antitoxin system RelE/ParE family toxin [Saprospiraceae bacterium]